MDHGRRPSAQHDSGIDPVQDRHASGADKQDPRLRQLATAGSHGHQISKAIDWLQENYAESLRIDDLAAHAGMSTSAFHHHFRSMTAMSPLQYHSGCGCTRPGA